LKKISFFLVSNATLIYVVGVNSSIAKGTVKVFGTYVIRRDLK
jgi:hypothetical protein